MRAAMSTKRKPSIGDSTARPFPTTSRARVQDLYPELLDGAKTALRQVREGMEAGLASRDLKELAVTANVLLRAAKLLEGGDTESTTGAGELQEQADEIVRLKAELAKRKRE